MFLRLLLCSVGVFIAAEPVLNIPGFGKLEGRTSSLADDVVNFYRIPYAVAPVGDLRWRPPRTYGPWQGTLNATVYGSRCFGLDSEQGVDESEDCLFLNVFAPRDALGSDQRLPVMVYIHGGAFTGGSSNHNHPDALVARSNASVVLVTLNYRLNIFGFLGTRLLRSRAADGSTGNYGLQDQRAALSWVRAHIAAFGGNDGAVTIFGESAGGLSVLQHLVQPASVGLYDKAIIESGDYRGSVPLGDAEKLFADVLNNTNCTRLGVDCLLQAPPAALVRAARRAKAWGPVIDGVELRAYPQDLLWQGDYNNDVPVLLGSNRDEAALWTANKHGKEWLPPNYTEAQLDAYLTDMLAFLGQADREELKNLYSPSSYTYPDDLGNYSLWWWMATRIGTDGGSPPSNALGHCCVRRAARALLKGGSPGVFVYVFAHPAKEALRDLNEGDILSGTGVGSPLVPHASELPFVFAWVDALSHEGGEIELARSVSGYWLNFARHGNPNGEALPQWPSYNRATDAIMRLEAQQRGLTPQYLLRDDACSFWDEHYWTHSWSEETDPNIAAISFV